MARENSNEFLQNQEYELSDERFYHEDEFNRDVEIGLYIYGAYRGQQVFHLQVD
jgi:hypothetical protein